MQLIKRFDGFDQELCLICFNAINTKYSSTLIWDRNLCLPTRLSEILESSARKRHQQSNIFCPFLSLSYDCLYLSCSKLKPSHRAFNCKPGSQLVLSSQVPSKTINFVFVSIHLINLCLFLVSSCQSY